LAKPNRQRAEYVGFCRADKPGSAPLVRANYKDRFGASVGYLTADPTGIKISKA
jgi:hypothetical protein